MGKCSWSVKYVRYSNSTDDHHVTCSIMNGCSNMIWIQTQQLLMKQHAMESCARTVIATAASAHWVMNTWAFIRGAKHDAEELLVQWPMSNVGVDEVTCYEWHHVPAYLLLLM